MRSAFSALVLLATLVAPVRGQDAEPVTSHAAAAAELIDLMQMERAFMNYENTLSSVAPPMPGMEKMRGVMAEFMREFLPWPVIKAEYVSIYQDLFTEQEIRELIVFYRTPIGEKLLAQSPELSVRTAQIVQSKIQEHQPELMRRIGVAMQVDRPPAN